MHMASWLKLFLKLFTTLLFHGSIQFSKTVMSCTAYSTSEMECSAKLANGLMFVGITILAIKFGSIYIDFAQHIHYQPWTYDALLLCFQAFHQYLKLCVPLVMILDMLFSQITNSTQRHALGAFMPYWKWLSRVFIMSTHYFLCHPPSGTFLLSIQL